MKKIGVILALVGTIGVGGVLAVGTINDGQDSSSVETNIETSLEVVIPKERTVDTKDNFPWEYASRDVIAEWQEQGETVYLWDDAPHVEELLIKSINEEREDKAESLVIVGGYIEQFINEVSEYKTDSTDYFATLQQAVDLAKNMSTEEAIQKINEAKQLREAK